MRVAIGGVPRAGKTTLAGSLSLPVLHTDSLIELGWSESSAHAAKWFSAPGAWVVEGVAVPRALRKWLAANPEGAPVDRVIYLREPRTKLTKGQRTMAKGCEKVWVEVIGELTRRGVEVFDVAEASDL